MSFILQNYSRASVSYNKDSFGEYNYIHPTDTVTDMNANDYFLSQQRSLNINDIIKAQTVGVGGVTSLKITAVVPVVTTVIDSQASDDNADVVFNTLQLKNLNSGHLVSSVLNALPPGQSPELIDTPDLRVVGEGITMGAGGSDASAILQAHSTTQGFLPPVMTEAQRDAIATPAEGLIIFSTTDDALHVRAGGVWKVISAV